VGTRGILLSRRGKGEDTSGTLILFQAMIILSISGHILSETPAI
jgi:hypothetical protein